LGEREVRHLWAITFNGEVYNHAEVRAELETLGCNFATRSDTEVLINWWTGITMFPADHVQRALDGFIASMDQPTMDGLNTYLVSQAAATSINSGHNSRRNMVGS
jgi:hypothetical protein